MEESRNGRDSLSREHLGIADCPDLPDFRRRSGTFALENSGSSPPFNGAKNLRRSRWSWTFRGFWSLAVKIPAILCGWTKKKRSKTHGRAKNPWHPSRESSPPSYWVDDWTPKRKRKNWDSYEESRASVVDRRTDETARDRRNSTASPKKKLGKKNSVKKLGTQTSQSNEDLERGEGVGFFSLSIGSSIKIPNCDQINSTWLSNLIDWVTGVDQSDFDQCRHLWSTTGYSAPSFQLMHSLRDHLRRWERGQRTNEKPPSTRGQRNRFCAAHWSVDVDVLIACGTLDFWVFFYLFFFHRQCAVAKRTQRRSTRSVDVRRLFAEFLVSFLLLCLFCFCFVWFLVFFSLIVVVVCTVRLVSGTGRGRERRHRRLGRRSAGAGGGAGGGGGGGGGGVPGLRRRRRRRRRQQVAQTGHGEHGALDERQLQRVLQHTHTHAHKSKSWSRK